MKHQAIAHQPFVLEAPGHRAVARVSRFVVDRFLLLPIGAAVALVWANAAPESYFRFAHAIAFPVNEIAMALFLALVTQEVLEAMMPGGGLHTWRRWTMPIVAAGGGVVGAAGVYLLYVSLRHELVLAQAWPVACAIDVAASYYVLKLVGFRGAPLPFALLIGLATDALGLAIVALRPPVAAVRFESVLLMIAALGLAAALRHRRIRSFWPYLAVCGPLSWFALYWQGIHPALALVPIVPFLPREPRPVELFAERPDDDAVHHVEHEWNELVQVILLLFGLANAGVVLRGYGTGTWAMLTAGLVGRPLGILAAVGLATVFGLHLPRRVGWRDLALVALATTSGFTFALFFATGLIGVGPVLAEIKLGALATVAGALIVLAIGKQPTSPDAAHGR
jgi:NhaA family Na+:H+ antiporter